MNAYAWLASKGAVRSNQPGWRGYVSVWVVDEFEFSEADSDLWFVHMPMHVELGSGCDKHPKDAVQDFIRKSFERIAVEEERNAKIAQRFHVAPNEEE